MMNAREQRTTNKIAKTYDVSGCASIEDVLRNSETDWSAEIHSAGGQSFSADAYKAIVRPDTSTALAFVSGRYRVNDHRLQLASLEPYVRQGDLIPENVSVWDNGAVLAYQFRAPNLDMTIHDRDVVSPLLTLAFAYGFPLSDSAFFADFRWFCKNQLGRVGKLMTDRVRHRGDVQTLFGDVLGSRLAELGGELHDHYKLLQRMPAKELGPRETHNYFAEVLGASKEEAEQAWVTPAEDLRGKAGKIPDILECYAVDDAGAGGTVWHAYNAVTRYATHKAGRTRESARRQILLGGEGQDNGAKLVSRAYNIAARMAA